MVAKIYEYWWSFWKNVGFTLGSSYFLSNRLAKLALKDNPSKILEVGAGKGAVTKQLVKIRGSNMHLVTCEINRLLYRDLKKITGVNLTHFNESIISLKQKYTAGEFDSIVSTLPLGSFDVQLRRDVLEAMQYLLRDGGAFIQYQYWPKNKHEVSQYFSIQKVGYELRNIPPVFIYKAKK